MQYSTCSFAEIQIPQSKIEKAFSSFSDINKYEFKAGMQVFSGSTNSSIGVNANIYNNMANNFAPMIGMDFRYHLFNFDNKISNFTKNIVEKGVSFDIKTNNKLDFSLKLGMRFKINKTISLTPYGIVGFSWNKFSIDNSSIRPLQSTADDNSLRETNGLKLLMVDNIGDFLNKIKQAYDENETEITTEKPLEIYYFNKNYQINGELDNIAHPDGPMLGEQIYYEGSVLKMDLDGDGFSELEGFDNIVKHIKDKAGCDMIILKSYMHDDKTKNYIIEAILKDIDGDGKLDLMQKIIKDVSGIYEKRIVDENGNIELEYKKFILPKELKKTNLLNLKYGAGIEIGIKNNIFITLEYRYSRPDIAVLYNNSVQQNYNFSIHEINFGVGFYFI